MKPKSIVVILLVALVLDSCAPKSMLTPTEIINPTAVFVPTVPVMPTPISTDTIAGDWIGVFQGISDDFSAEIHVSINKNCETNNVCGTYSVPSLPCSGDLILTRVDNTTFVFVEQKTDGADWCGSGGFEYMELLPDNTLSWGYSDTGESIKSKGSLMGSSTGKLIFQYSKEGYEKDFPELKGNSNLFAVNLDGTNLTPVTNGLLDYSALKGISPDGRKALLFFAPENYTATESTSILYVMDLESKDPQPIKLASGIFESVYQTATWLDNSHVVYIDQVPGGWAIFTINSDGTDPKRISQKVNGITPREVFVTADQSRVYWLGVDASSRSWTHKGIWWTSIDGTQQEQLISFQSKFNLSFSLNSISPYGNMVIWEHNTWSQTGRECCSVRFALASDMDKATEIKLEPKNGPLVGPSPEYLWSSDESMVIINRQASSVPYNNETLLDSGQMFTLSVKDLKLKEILLKTPDTMIRNPSVDIIQWLPDGKNLLVRVTLEKNCQSYASAYQCSGGKIKILNLETGNFIDLLGDKVLHDSIGNILWLSEQ